MPKAWEELKARAGLHDVTLHTLRHSFASIAIYGFGVGCEGEREGKIVNSFIKHMAKEVIVFTIKWLMLIAVLSIPIGYFAGNIYVFLSYGVVYSDLVMAVAVLHLLVAAAIWYFYLWPAWAVIVGNMPEALDVITGESKHNPVKKYDPVSGKYDS